MNPALDRDPPGKLASGVMAVLVHVAFFALLFFGVNWQRRAPDAVVVELWNTLPPAPAVKVQPPAPSPAPPKLEVKPPPPQPPQVKPEPKAAPKPEPKPQIKPDIALEKEKQEKARREEREKAEQKKRELQAKAEEKKREEREKAEQQKREDAKQRLAALEKERKAREAEIARQQKEQEDAVARIAQQQAAAQSKEVDEFRRRISDKIRRYVNKEPCGSLGNPEIVFEAVLLPDGNLLPPPRIRRSSGNAACDDAVLRAVMRAQPLPLPADPTLFARFRELNLQFRPNE